MTVPLLIDSFQEAAADNVTNCDLAAKVYAATQLPSRSTWPTKEIFDVKEGFRVLFSFFIWTYLKARLSLKSIFRLIRPKA